MVTGSSSPLLWNPLIGHEQSYLFAESEAFFHFPPSSQPQIGGYDLASLKPSTAAGSFSDLAVIKKVTHNACERHRRKKINSLYSSLRSLLPVADQKKKLSNPSTISRVLSYIPELQNQMEELLKRKEELLLSMAAGQEYSVNNEQNKKIKSESWSSNVLSAVSANKLNEREVSIHLSLDHIHKNQFSEILPALEDDGLQLMNASSFNSQTGKTFFDLHLQVESNHRWESGIVKEGLMHA